MEVPAISQKVNGSDHLYEDSKYAHFSQITEHNKDLFPLFPQAKGVTITLEAGDCLFIPKKWWHWVKSFASTREKSRDPLAISPSDLEKILTEASKPRCLSINFWFPSGPDVASNDVQPFGATFCSTQFKALGDKTIPLKISHAIDDWDAFRNWTDDYLIERIDPAIPEGLWLFLNEGACAKRISLADFIKRYSPVDKSENPRLDRQEIYAYLITPSDYEPYKQKHNAKILDILKEDFHAPFPSEMVGTNANFWMNFGKIDTGLHYDDDDGLLCVVKGQKVVTLYPPSDSEFLYPYPIQPVKLTGYNKVFHPNLYIETPIEITLDSKHETECSSAQLLEVCLRRAPNVAQIARKLQDKFGPGRIVYGIKNMNGVVKYEFYFYGLDRRSQMGGALPVQGSYYSSPECNSDFELKSYLKGFHKELFSNDYYVLEKLDQKNLCVWSIDLTEESVLNGSTPNLNLYYACENSLSIPFLLAEKTYHKDGSNKLRSILRVGRYNEVLQNAESLIRICLSLGLVKDDISCLIKFVNGCPYKCDFVCLINKVTEIGLYFFGIAYRPFVDFLIKYDYPVALISLVVDHPHEVSQLRLEVGFHFAKGAQTHEPTRTAFYGLF